MIISQSVLSGGVEKNQRVLSGGLTRNQKVLSGNFIEKLVTNGRWGKITGDIYDQSDLIALLENYKNIVTRIDENQNGEEITIYYVDENDLSHSVTVPMSWVLERVRNVYYNGDTQDILAIVEMTENARIDWPDGSSSIVSLPELIFWVNDGTVDGKSIKLATVESTRNMLSSLYSYLIDYISTNITSISEHEIDVIILEDLI